jgi:hypothetical protein
MDRIDRLDRLEILIERLIEKMATLATAITNLQTAVTADTTVEQSAITLLNGIPALITAAVNQALANGATSAQLTALTTLATTIQQNSTNLAAAVTANTPVASS